MTTSATELARYDTAQDYADALMSMSDKVRSGEAEYRTFAEQREALWISACAAGLGGRVQT